MAIKVKNECRKRKFGEHSIDTTGVAVIIEDICLPNGKGQGFIPPPPITISV